MRKAIVVGVGLLAMSVLPAFARGGEPAASTKHMTDQMFVTDAAKGNMAEVELGKVAEAKASSDQVKSFAKQLVDVHLKALDDLKTVAKKDNLTLPVALDPKDQALKDRLDKLSGARFDRAYMNAIIKDHRRDVTEFQAESQAAKSADLKQYAAKMLPMLEDHLKTARTTDQAVIGTSGRRSKKTVG